MRRSGKYQRAAQECLSNLQGLHDQWVTERQALGPRPALSTNASAVATEIDGLLRINRSQIFLTARPPRLEEKRWLLLDLLPDEDAGGRLPTLSAEARLAVARELVVYWEWEDVNGLLNRHIAEYENLIDTLECAANFFCSWDPSLESLPGQSSKLSEPDTYPLEKFAVLCSKLYQQPAFLQQFAPLATLRHQHRILLPLDYRILQLPFLAAYAVFPDIRPYYPTRLYTKTEPRVINTLTFGHEASRASVHTAVNRLLPSAHSRIESLCHYSNAFEVYDLRGEGKSWAAIGSQVLTEDFKKIKKPFDHKNGEYKKFIQRVKDLYKVAKELIDNA